ncbi:hypothetical protein C8R45DRAFT_944596 [Mycena sanguinolenta]|nr:hypothetical protein C8R45DRAFT_944596 [Mycena sanguinolenta]
MGAALLLGTTAAPNGDPFWKERLSVLQAATWAEKDMSRNRRLRDNLQKTWQFKENLKKLLKLDLSHASGESSMSTIIRERHGVRQKILHGKVQRDEEEGGGTKAVEAHASNFSGFNN